MKSKLIVAGLMAALLAGVVAPSFARRARAAAPSPPAVTSVQAPPAILDKTRFLLHVGAAYFAFHHFVWARYKKHQLDLHHKANLIKAGLALLFAYHELKVANGIATKSHSKLLHALVSPLNALMGKDDSVGNQLKSGKLDASGLQDVNKSVDALQARAASNGLTIKDVPVPVPGA